MGFICTSSTPKHSIYIFLLDIKKRVSNLSNLCLVSTHAACSCTGCFRFKITTCAEGLNLCRHPDCRVFPSWNYSFPAGIILSQLELFFPSWEDISLKRNYYQHHHRINTPIHHHLLNLILDLEQSNLKREF